MSLLAQPRSALVLSTALLALAGCGSGGGTEEGDDNAKDSTSAPSSTTTSAAPRGGPDPRQTIQSFFTAKRLGKTEEGCALETESFQTQQYGGAGEPCLKNASNTMAQPVWATVIKIVSLKKAGEYATAVVAPNASSDAQAQVNLRLVDGAWLVDGLR